MPGSALNAEDSVVNERNGACCRYLDDNPNKKGKLKSEDPQKEVLT